MFSFVWATSASAADQTFAAASPSSLTYSLVVAGIESAACAPRESNCCCRSALSAALFHCQLPAAIKRGISSVAATVGHRAGRTNAGAGCQTLVMRLLSQGKPNKLIARDLGISEGTVKIHLAAIFRALNVRNRVEAVVASRKLQGL